MIPIVIIIVFFFLIARYYQRQGGKYAWDKGKWKEYASLIKDKPVVNNTLYGIHKGPREIKYIPMHKDITYLIEQLDFTRKYQPDLLLDVIIYLEYFFKIHYNVLIGKYNVCQNISVLRDIKRQVMSILSTFVFNLPDKSTIVDITDIDAFMQQRIRDMMAILNRYITMIKNKYEKQCMDVLDVAEYDAYTNNHNMFF